MKKIKTIWLDGNEFEYSTMKELRQECKKYSNDGNFNNGAWSYYKKKMW